MNRATARPSVSQEIQADNWFEETFPFVEIYRPQR